MNSVVYPRVLVVSACPLHAKNATGITLSQLFFGWPEDHLAQLYVEAWTNEAAQATAWRMEDSSFPLDQLLRHVSRTKKRVLSQKASPTAASALEPDRYSRPTRASLLLRSLTDMGPSRMHDTIQAKIQDFRPDVIYTPLGNLRLLGLVLAVARLTQCPVIPHFLDDWPKTLYSDSLVVAPARQVLNRRLGAILQQAPVGLAISPQMATEYERRYGLPFIPFMTCAEEKDFSVSDASAPRPRLRFVYAGGLHLERWIPLVTVAEEVVRSGHEMMILAPPSDIERYRSRFTPSPALHFDNVPFERLSTQLHAADVLIHVESFREDLVEYTRYSVSTKIPYYMAARRPILAVGPSGQAAVQVVLAAGAGIHVGSPDPKLIRKAVSTYGENDQLRERHASNGFRYAQQHFHGTYVRQRFREALMTGVTGGLCGDGCSPALTDASYA